MEPPKSSTRELTLEEAVSVAILLQKNKQFLEAQEIYRRVLEMAPDHPRALHYAGVLAHQQGRNEEALALIERSVAFVPDQADWYSNLGIVFQSEQRLDRAVEAYRRGSSSIRATRTPTTIWECCCGRPESRSKRKPHIVKPSG